MEPRSRRRRIASRPSGPPSAAPTGAEIPAPTGSAPTDVPLSDSAPNDPTPTDAAPSDPAPNDPPPAADHPRPRRRQRPPRSAPVDDKSTSPPEGRGRPTGGGGAEVGAPARGRGGDPDSDRSLRALVSIRGTQLPADIALRAREAANPSAADLAEAEHDVVLVRRHYVPPAPLSTARRPSEEPIGPRDARRRPGRTP